MTNPIPPYISIIFSLFTLGLVIATLKGLSFALKQKGLNPKKPVLYTTIGISIWLIILAVLSVMAFFFILACPKVFIGRLWSIYRYHLGWIE